MLATMAPSADNSRSLAASREQDADLGFTYRVSKRGEVEVLQRGRVAVTLRGARAAEFLAGAGAGFAELQQAMARLTGNYKRGNERLAGNHPRNRR
jgi:hypothetical protein